MTHDLSLIPREYRGIRTKQKRGAKNSPLILDKREGKQQAPETGASYEKKTRRERTYKKGLIYGLTTYVKVVSAAYSAPTLLLVPLYWLPFKRTELQAVSVC